MKKLISLIFLTAVPLVATHDTAKTQTKAVAQVKEAIKAAKENPTSTTHTKKALNKVVGFLVEEEQAIVDHDGKCYKLDALFEEVVSIVNCLPPFVSEGPGLAHPAGKLPPVTKGPGLSKPPITTNGNGGSSKPKKTSSTTHSKPPVVSRGHGLVKPPTTPKKTSSTTPPTTLTTSNGDGGILSE